MEQAPKPAEALKPKSRTMFLAIVIVVILVVVGVGIYILIKPPSSPPTSGPQIAIKDDGICNGSAMSAACNYAPFLQNATSGGPAVVWTNQGTVVAGHTVTTCDSANRPTAAECPSGNDASSLDSFNLPFTSSGQQQQHSFSAKGTYYYYCAIHPWMHGEVVVS